MSEFLRSKPQRLHRIKKKVPAKQFQIFDFYVLKGWSVRKVAATLGVNIGQVYLAKHRVSQLVRKEIRNLENTMFETNHALAVSALDVSAVAEVNEDGRIQSGIV